MKAMLFHEHGGPEVLTYTDFPTPEPGAGEALVKLEAAAMNRVDVWAREGWPGIKLEYPHILGSDGAGRVAGLGAGVEGFAEGDRVVINANLADGICKSCVAGQDNRCDNWHLLGETIRGTYAEYISIAATNLMQIPEGFEAARAAAAGLVFHTAWHSLITRGGLQAGESVLVVGASGGVNTASIQVAKLAGAEVYVVGAGAEKLAVAEELGADHLIDRSKEENWSKAVYLLTGKRGVDVAVDNVGTTFPLSLRALRKGGRLLTVGNTAAPKFEFDNRYMFAKHLSIIGSTMGTREDFSTVMALVFAGKLRPAMDETFPLEEAQEAHRRMEAGKALGKITLAIN